MKKSVLSSASVVLFGAAVAAVLVFSTGCEWESTDSEGSWSDSMSWVNFSGLYRSGSSGRPLVSNFSLSSGGTEDTGTDSGGSTTPSDFTETAVTQNDVFTVDNSIITTLGNTINYSGRGDSGWSIKPGSVNVRLANDSGASGSFSDNGSGALAGTFSIVQGDSPKTGSGSIDYDTGAWSLALDDVFLGPADVSYDYTILSPKDAAPPADDDDDSEDPPTSGDWVYTLQVAQTGNRLSFTDNRGFVWEGVLSSVTTPGGDDTGQSPGDVVGTFEVKGVTDARYKITGTFKGRYNVLTRGDATYGQMTSRSIQGIWMEPGGNGDLYGETSDAGQTAVTTTD